MVKGASYAGSNLLTGGLTDTTVMTSYNRDATAGVTTGSITITFSDVQLIDDPDAPTAGILGKDGTASSTSILRYRRVNADRFSRVR